VVEEEEEEEEEGWRYFNCARRRDARVRNAVNVTRAISRVTCGSRADRNIY